MMRSLMWLFAAMTLVLQAYGSEPVPQDFAYGFTVESKIRGALWRVDLPDAVYRSAARADLGDIRVFNRAGRIVPHLLELPETELDTVPEPVFIRFFPLHTRVAEIIDGKLLRIITDNMGTIVDASNMAAPADTTDRVVAYLLDTRALEHTPNRLKLLWDPPQDTGFTAIVAIESSDDLLHWAPLVKEATLAHLTAGMAVLSHNTIDLPPRKTDYLRITWPKELEDVALSAVQVSFRATGKPPVQRRLEVGGVPATDDLRVFDFDAGGYWPVETASMEFGASNTMVTATLLSRPAQQANWRIRHSGVFYTLDYEGKTLKSQPVKTGRTTDRYWRFRIEDEQGHVSGSPPHLVLGWMPHRITFVAQGEPPYTVVFGNAAMAKVTGPIDALLQSIDEQDQGLVVPASASSVFELGGKARLEPPAAPFPWGKLVLWLVLLAGVAILAWMVRSLVHQMEPRDS